MVRFGTDTKAMEAGFQKADGLIAANAEKFKKAGRIMTVAGAAIVGSIGLMIKNYTDAGDAIHKMSKRTGFSCEALSALKYAAEISGSSIESLEKGVKKMSMSIYDGTRGSLEYVEAFEQIGLSAEELVDLSPEEQFMKIAEGLAEMENKGTRAALAQKLLGRAGTELIPLFEEGADGIKRLTEEAARMGFIFDTEAAANAAKLKDAQTDLKVAFQGVGLALADTLVPAITSFTGKVADTIAKVKDWIKEHPILTELIMKVVGAVGILATVLGPILIMLPGIAAGLSLVGVGGVATGAGTTVGAAGVSKLGVAFKAALGPLGLIITALLAGGAALNAWINAQKKALDAEMDAMVADKTLAEVHELRRKAIEKGILTQQEWAAEVNKFGKDYKAFLTAVSTAPEYETLRGELEGIRKVEEDLGTETKEQTAAMIAEKLRLAEALKAANEKMTGLTKAMVNEIKKVTLDEYAYSKWALDQKLADREAAIEAEKAGEAEKNTALAAARASFDAEDAALDKAHKNAAIARDVEAATKKTELLEQLKAEERAWKDAHLTEQEALTDSLKQMELDKYQYALWALDQRYEKEKETSTNLELLKKEYDAKREEIEDQNLEDQKARIDEEEAHKKQSLENTLADIGMVLNTIGSLFSQAHQNRMTEIDQEETRRIDAINAQYDAQIAALQGIVAAEEAKTQEVLDSINREYDDKRQYILDNMADNEERAVILAQLEKKHEMTLEQARIDRKLAEEKAAADLLAIEEAKNEALRIASEVLEGKREAARRTAAKQEKAVALMSAIVNTAAGVAKALPNIPLAIAVGIMGAAQIALIAAQPIPLKEGGIAMQPITALIGERGPEAVIPLNRLQPAFAGAPVSFKQTNYFYGDINSGHDIDEISDRLARRMTQQLERGRRS